MKEQYTYKFTDKGLEEYVKLIRRTAVLAEREACAKVCDELSNPFGNASLMAEQCAAAIRARTT